MIFNNDSLIFYGTKAIVECNSCQTAEFIARALNVYIFAHESLIDEKLDRFKRGVINGNDVRKHF